MIFRALSPEEKQSFRNWARDNYIPFSEIQGFWHPIVQEECVKINSEKATIVLDKGNALET